MTEIDLAVAICALGAVSIIGRAIWQRRPPPPRVRAMLAGPSRGAAEARMSFVRLAVVGVGRLAFVTGSTVSRMVGRSPDAHRDRRLGIAVISAAVLVPVSWPVAAVTSAAVWVVPALTARVSRARRAEAVLDELPDVVDVINLAISAGCSLRLALDAVVAHGRRGVVVDELGAVCHRLDSGASLPDALVHLATLGDVFRPVLDAMLRSSRVGAPLGGSLARIATDLRRARRRRAEELARRVPIKLLFPLVFCTLPAFGLLTVVPLLVSALRTLSL
jgi:tight adherence protein C